MKTRTLFLTLFTSISILLIAQGLAFADPPPVITGCLQKSTGKIYNAQIATIPTLPCSLFDQEISWDQEGPAGADGVDGQDGEQGPPGPAGGGSQFVLMDNDENPVGTVVTITDTVGSFVEDDQVFLSARRIVTTRVEYLNGVGATVPVAFRVGPNRLLNHNQVLFESGDCSGTGYMADILLNNVEMGPAITQSAVVGDTGPNGERRLYVPVAEPPQNRNFNSFSEVVCNSFINNPANILSVTAEEIDPDMYATFPRPYTLEAP